MSLDRDTIERLRELMRTPGGEDADLPRETRGAKAATKSRVNQADVPRTTTGDAIVWDLDVLEGWYTEETVADSTGTDFLTLRKYTRYRCRDGSGTEGFLNLNRTTRTETPETP